MYALENNYLTLNVNRYKPFTITTHGDNSMTDTQLERYKKESIEIAMTALAHLKDGDCVNTIHVLSEVFNDGARAAKKESLNLNY